MATYDVAIKKEEVLKSNCNIPAGYVRLSSVLSSLETFANDAAAKEAGLVKCDLYINSSTGALTVVDKAS